MAFAEEKKFFMGGILFGLVLGWLLTFAFICLDPHYIQPASGSPGEPCFPNATCYEGLHCGEIPELHLKHVCLEDVGP